MPNINNNNKIKYNNNKLFYYTTKQLPGILIKYTDE